MKLRHLIMILVLILVGCKEHKIGHKIKNKCDSCGYNKAISEYHTELFCGECDLDYCPYKGNKHHTMIQCKKCNKIIIIEKSDSHNAKASKKSEKTASKTHEGKDKSSAKASKKSETASKTDKSSGYFGYGLSYDINSGKYRYGIGWHSGFGGVDRRGNRVFNVAVHLSI